MLIGLKLHDNLLARKRCYNSRHWMGVALLVVFERYDCNHVSDDSPNNL